MVKEIRIGVIPAAGEGRRINSLPLTRVLPKSLLPILNKPILEYVIENMKKMGVEEVYMIVGFKKELIQEYFGNGEDFGVNIDYILQPDPRGIADAVGLTQDHINEPFVVILGDDLTIAESFDNLVKDFWTKGAMVVEGLVLERDVEKLKQTCCVKLDKNGKVLDIVEKPSAPKSNVRGCGIYVFDPTIYGYIEKTPVSPPRYEREITNTIKLLAAKEQAYGSFINGVNVNINTVHDLLKATRLVISSGRKGDRS